MLRKIRLIITVLAVVSVVLAVYFFSGVNSSVSDQPTLIYFEVETGSSVKTIAKNLHQQQLITSANLFKWYVWYQGAQSKLLAGEYKLSPDMSLKEIADTLITGKAIDNEKQITVIEGWTAKQIGEYLESQRLVTQEEFLKAIATDLWTAEYAFLANIPADTIEGFLFPDTYRIYTDATVEEIIRKMLDNLDRKLTPEVKQEIANQGSTIYDTIVLASIVEREALKDDDKRMIADIFKKRIAEGIPLQSDATVNYVTGKSELRPSYADLEVDSPYNTYKYAGLTPGPISNPGEVAILAAVYPTQNNYYYFISNDEGDLIYGRTYEEHQANIAKYLD